VKETTECSVPQRTIGYGYPNHHVFQKSWLDGRSLAWGVGVMGNRFKIYYTQMLDVLLLGSHDLCGLDSKLQSGFSLAPEIDT